MRGLSEAALLLVSALARGVDAVAHREYGEPSALITIELPGVEPSRANPYMSFRFDVLESLQACGVANATVNGQSLPVGDTISVQTGPQSGVDGGDTDGQTILEWSSTCLAWDGQESEQRLDLRVLSVNGVSVSPRIDDSDPSGALTIRFRQTAPVRVIDVEGAVSVFRFYDQPARIVKNQDDKTISEDDVDTEAAELLAWQQNLSELRQHAALVRHDIRTRERYIRYRFGGASDSSFWGAIIRKIGSIMGSYGHAEEAIRAQYSWDAYSPFVENTACSSQDDGNSSAQTSLPPPPLPPPAPAFLFRCPSSGADREHDQDPARQSEDDGSDQSEEDVPSHGDNGNSTGVAGHEGDESTDETSDQGHKAWPAYIGPQHKYQMQGIYGMLTYLLVVAILAYLITKSVRRCHERMRYRQRLYGRDVEEGRMGATIRNRATHFRGRVTGWYQTFSTGIRERRARRQERRQERPSVWERRRERQQQRRLARETDGVVRVSFPATVLRFLKRVLLGRGDDDEKLGTSTRPQTRQPGSASGHIETVVVRPPSPQDEQPEEQRLYQEEEQRLYQEEEQRLYQEEQRLYQQEEQIRYQQMEDQMQQQVEQRLREQQFLAQQLEEQRDQQRQLREQQRQQELREQEVQRQREEEQRLKQQAASSAAAHEDRTPSPTLEQEIASFRAAADVVDQIIAAEEGRMAGVRTAEARRQRDQQQILSALSRSSAPRVVASASSSGPSFHRQPLAPPPPPPPPSTVGSATMTPTTTTARPGARMSTSGLRTYGYRRHDPSGIDSDFDDTESLPPAYSETSYTSPGFASTSTNTSAGFTAPSFSYDDLAEAEASMVADGFQYHPGGNRY